MRGIIALLTMGALLTLGLLSAAVGYAGEIAVSDSVCGTTHLCDAPWTDCVNSSAFTVPADGDYTLEVSLVCADQSYCEKCLACARILDGGGREVCVQHTLCQANDCATTAICHLLRGVPYTLQVCKRLCPGYDNCQACGTCSVAEAKLVY